MDITIKFPGGKRVDAHFGEHTMHTDQSPEHGGEGAAPEPFDTFLASMATCAGIYVLGFCQARKIPTTGIEVLQRASFDGTNGALSDVEIVIVLPDDFPIKYRVAIGRAAAGCKVKKVLEAPPHFVVSTRDKNGGLLARADSAERGAHDEQAA